MTEDITASTSLGRDFDGDTRILVVRAPCPEPKCGMVFSGSSGEAARRALDGHYEYVHPGVPPAPCDATVLRRKSTKANA